MVTSALARNPRAADVPRLGVLYLYPDDIEEYHRQVRDSGLHIPDLDVTFYGMREFRLDDPDGNRLWIGMPGMRASAALQRRGADACGFAVSASGARGAP